MDAKKKQAYKLDQFNILIADDYEFTTELLASMLREFGVGKTQTALNGTEAQILLSDQNREEAPDNIDVLILDWLMPGKTGGDILKWVRSHDCSLIRFIPVILCSAYVTEDLAIEARNLGATEVMVKPLSAEKLSARIRHVIDFPRPFIQTETFFGPDRRRREMETDAPNRRTENPEPAQEITNENGGKVLIFKRENKLKAKAGLPMRGETAGFIPPSRIEGAQKAITGRESLYMDEVERLLQNIELAYRAILGGTGDKVAEVSRIHICANNIKDLTSTYQRSLMLELSRSLRDFCEVIDTDKQENFIILKAHIDAMNMTLKEKLSDSESQVALQLKQMLKKAIEKYS